jgi:hypothetical protein
MLQLRKIQELCPSHSLSKHLRIGSSPERERTLSRAPPPWHLNSIVLVTCVRFSGQNFGQYQSWRVEHLSTGKGILTSQLFRPFQRHRLSVSHEFSESGNISQRCLSKITEDNSLFKPTMVRNLLDPLSSVLTNSQKRSVRLILPTAIR